MSLQDDTAQLETIRQQIDSAANGLAALMGAASTVTNSDSSSRLAKPAHFKIFRDYVEHEDDLINKRLLWNINIQGFLFATYGFCIQKLAEVKTDIAISAHYQGTAMEGIATRALIYFMGMLPVFGILISIFSWLGVFAAQRAIAQLACDWTEIEKDYSPGASQPRDYPKMPGIIGGGYCGAQALAESEYLQAHKAHKMGFYAPQWFPWLFVAAWLATEIVYWGPWFMAGKP